MLYYKGSCRSQFVMETRTVAVPLSVSQHKALKEIGKRGLRPLSKQGEYFLEAFAGAARQEPSLRVLKAPPEQPLASEYNRFVLPVETYDYYLHWAGDCGINIGPFLKIVLWNVARRYLKLAPKTVLSKEELIDKLVCEAREARQPTIQ